MNDPKSFDLLYKGALSADTSGWDFSFLRNRKSTEDLPWDYKKIVAGYLKNTNSLLDMGTGGGELLSTLTPLPAKVCATEGYEPNYSIAKDKLGNMGVEVFFVKDHNKLAFKDNSFGLIINRHEDFEPGELRRILIDGGIFVTQQVGGKNNININRFLNDKSLDNNNYNLDNTINILKEVKFKILKSSECFPKARFYDVGALIYYLRKIPWQIPGFKIEDNIHNFKKLHNLISNKGYFESIESRFLIVAKKNLD